MTFTQEGTTKRYKGNESCCIENFSPTSEDSYQYGCEFEFYINTDIDDYETIINKMSKELYTLTDADLLVDTLSLPTAKDKDRCMQIKPDISLQDTGIEISTPISHSRRC